MSDPDIPSAEAKAETPPTPPADHAAHWKGSIRIVLGILATWFFISLGCSVLFREFLDSHLPSVGGAPFGFWMAQQGSILGFVLLLIVYRKLMNSLDQRHHLEDEA